MSSAGNPNARRPARLASPRRPHQCRSIIIEDWYDDGREREVRCALYLGHDGPHTDAAHISWSADERGLR